MSTEFDHGCDAAFWANDLSHQRYAEFVAETGGFGLSTIQILELLDWVEKKIAERIEE